MDLVETIKKSLRQALRYQLTPEEIVKARKGTFIKTDKRYVEYSTNNEHLYVIVLESKKEPNADRTGYIYVPIFHSEEKYTMGGVLVERMTDRAYGESIENESFNFHSEKVYSPGSWFGKKKRE